MFEFKPADTARLKSIYGAAAVSDVSRRALNDTRKSLITEVGRQTRDIFNIKVADAKPSKVTVSAQGANLSATAIYRGNRPSLGRFATRAQKKIRVKVKRGAIKTVRDGFRMKNRPEFASLIWKRLSPAEAASNRYKGRKSKLKVLRSIAPPEMVRSVSDNVAVTTAVSGTYERRFDHYFKRKLGFR